MSLFDTAGAPAPFGGPVSGLPPQALPAGLPPQDAQILSSLLTSLLPLLQHLQTGIPSGSESSRLSAAQIDQEAGAALLDDMIGAALRRLAEETPEEEQGSEEEAHEEAQPEETEGRHRRRRGAKRAHISPHGTLIAQAERSLRNRDYHAALSLVWQAYRLNTALRLARENGENETHGGKTH